MYDPKKHYDKAGSSIREVIHDWNWSRSADLQW